MKRSPREGEAEFTKPAMFRRCQRNSASLKKEGAMEKQIGWVAMASLESNAKRNF
jgi:hypothetical protein